MGIPSMKSITSNRCVTRAGMLRGTTILWFSPSNCLATAFMILASLLKSNSSLICFASSSTALTMSNLISVLDRKSAHTRIFSRSIVIVGSELGYWIFTATMPSSGAYFAMRAGSYTRSPLLFPVTPNGPSSRASPNATTGRYSNVSAIADTLSSGALPEGDECDECDEYAADRRACSGSYPVSHDHARRSERSGPDVPDDVF
mmetsp:Transcript_4523/g.12789  ORF Transcript_4523/g.12789 Transcript_4523/m.12789 type:complete len:203 (-) Transcript_4523:244-852(-)